MDAFDLSRMFFGLLAVLAMIGLCALLARKAGLAAGGASLGARRRLQLVETIALDARRRAAILRCDGREHLILLGPSGETLVEANLPARPSSDEAAREAFPIAEALRRFKTRQGAGAPTLERGADAA